MGGTRVESGPTVRAENTKVAGKLFPLLIPTKKC